MTRDELVEILAVERHLPVSPTPRRASVDRQPSEVEVAIIRRWNRDTDDRTRERRDVLTEALAGYEDHRLRGAA